MKISVTLIPDKNPPVSVSPEKYSVSIGGVTKIEWTCAGSQKFDFICTDLAKNFPEVFYNEHANGCSMTIEDHHILTSPAMDYEYIITVCQNGNRYTSQATAPFDVGKPVIRNR